MLTLPAIPVCLWWRPSAKQTMRGERRGMEKMRKKWRWCCRLKLLLRRRTRDSLGRTRDSLCPSPLPRFQQRCLCTSHRGACEKISDIQAVLKGRTVAIRKGNKHQLSLFSLLEACQRNAAVRSTAGWPANAKLPLPHHHYMKRGSASYIVREVRSVRERERERERGRQTERERERERERDREEEIDGSDVTLVQCNHCQK